MSNSYFLNIYKEKGITSFDVISKLRKKLNIKKIGHGGTLDPLASGVLPVAVGDCTRLIEYLNDDKKYIATVKFGENSTTYDEEGEKTFIKEPVFTLEELENTLSQFKGKIKQKPPMYSAIKIKGKKLYEIARKGESVEIPEREIEIYDIKILDFKLPYVKLEVSCSKGTYIRSLAYDLGCALGCGAYISDLTRTQAGNFKIENSSDLEGELTPVEIEDVLSFDKYYLDDAEYNKIKNGMKIKSKIDMKDKILMLIYNKRVVSISKISDNIIVVEKNLKE